MASITAADPAQLQARIARLDLENALLRSVVDLSGIRQAPAPVIQGHHRLSASTSDVYLDALERIQKRGRSGTISQALDDIAKAFAATNKLEAEYAELHPTG